MRTAGLICVLLLAALVLPAAYAECPASEDFCIKQQAFGDGMKITLLSPDLRVSLLTKGATLSTVRYLTPFPGSPKQQWTDVVLGFDTPEEFDADTAYMGRVVGRYAGRIGKAMITVDGVNYTLPKNEGNNTLHGGPNGFSFRQWKHTLINTADAIGVQFVLVSPHLDEGFPGELLVKATYTIPKKTAATLRWNLQAELLETSPVNATVVNLCNHVYWNLNGVPRRDNACAGHVPEPVTNHLMLLRSRHFLAADEENIPWGNVRMLKDTPHDYRKIHALKDGIDATAAEGRDPAGYDDSVILDDWDRKLREAVLLESPKTKISLSIKTTSPAVVMYTANYLPENATGDVNDRFQQHSGIALETQYYPNSPNVYIFPTTELRKGNKYDETTECTFSSRLDA